MKLNTRVFPKRGLTTLLQQTSAVQVAELAKAIDDELVTELELEGGLFAAKVTGAVPGTAAESTEDAAEVVAVADAGAASADYEQAEAQAVIDLANDIKAKYNAAVVLINELQEALNTNSAILAALQAKVNAMNA